MYTVLRSSRRRTCLRRSPRSSSFLLYVSTRASSWFTRSDECLRGRRAECGRRWVPEQEYDFYTIHPCGCVLNYWKPTTLTQASVNAWNSQMSERGAEWTSVCGQCGSCFCECKLIIDELQLKGKRWWYFTFFRLSVNRLKRSKPTMCLFFSQYFPTFLSVSLSSTTISFYWRCQSLKMCSLIPSFTSEPGSVVWANRSL